MTPQKTQIPPNFICADCLSYHPMSDCLLQSFHTKQSKKKKTFYESTHIIFVGHALSISDMFIKNCRTQICADKNMVRPNVKANYIISTLIL